MKERGSASAELVVCTPVLLLVALVAMAIGRLVSQQSQVVDITRAAAEAASVWPTPAAAAAAAGAAAAGELGRDGLACRSRTLAVDTSRLYPGGSVRVDLTCVVTLAVAGVPGLPGSVTLRASATAPIETYREVG